ncbi:cytochrome b [Allorhizobium sp. BGMRC 0089]|uniref:cytochrome b n=1 Tax=Allorhizobium sonneratiae TaxID=2934936 RepID=UPI0020343F63|nr:cytochrome b [Allorhizobium sonneratiae]MCM2293880.1 cytochrome b [Allorhizobium sonneratiae]
MASAAIAASSPTSYRYRGLQRAIHWAMALIIISALALGLYCSYLAPGTPLREFLLDIHKSLGMTALVLIVLRLPVRAVYGEPSWQKRPSLLVRAGAHGAHMLLYVLMILMPVTGYITSGASGHDLPWFGLFTWPNILPMDRDLSRLAGMIHHFGAYTFFAVLGLHLAAVAWHRLVKKDEVLSRML